MRICLVSTELAPFAGWGVGAATAQAARALAAAGHDAHVLTEHSPALREDLARAAERRALPGVRLHEIDRSGPASLPHVPCPATRLPLAVYRSLRQLHDEHAFDAIEFTDLYAPAYSVLQARRTLGEFDGVVLAVRLHSPIFALRPINAQRSLNLNIAAVEHLEIEALRGADLVLSPSRAMLDLVRPRTGDLGPRAAVVPYPFDFAWLDSLGGHGAPPAAAPPVPEILFLGRLEYRKGVHLLIDAAQRLLRRGIPLRVRIVGVDTPTAPGERPMRPWLQQIVAPACQGSFIFQDNRRRADLGALISHAAVVCVPSLWDNFPNVCLEAMACGKVVVASRAGGIPELIEHGVSGLLFDPGSPESLESTLLSALRDAPLRAAIAAAAPRRVRTLCDPSAVARRIADALESARPRPVQRPSTTPLVSVIIPFFNLSAFLPAALESVRSQTYTNLETVIVDDGSTEPQAAPLLDETQRDWSGPGSLRILRQKNRGLSAARNAAIAAARGRWIVPLDADDALDPRFIELTLAAAARDPGVALVTSWMSCFEETPERPAVAYVPLGFDRDLLSAANVASSCTALLDREAVRAAGGYDESLPAFEDWDLYCTLAERGARAAVVPAFLIRNRIRPTSMLRSLSVARRRELHDRVRERHPDLAIDPERARRIVAAINAAAPRPRARRWNDLIRRVLRR